VVGDLGGEVIWIFIAEVKTVINRTKWKELVPDGRDYYQRYRFPDASHA
jgi:hypothetical protein